MTQHLTRDVTCDREVTEEVRAMLVTETAAMPMVDTAVL